ncbi:MAG: PEGA domain-containing protein [Deltaproteobacteria bacterium]|nr:PEGA domain-containing protein [Deltaproteobacteria bacterium]
MRLTPQPQLNRFSFLQGFGVSGISLGFLLASVLMVSPQSHAQDDDDDDDILMPADDQEKAEEAAGEKIKVGFTTLVPVGKADAPIAEQVSKSLLKEFSSSDRLHFSDLNVQARGDAKTTVDTSLGQKSLKSAEKNARRGKKELVKLRFGRAEKYLKKAIGKFEASPAAIVDVNPLVEAHIKMAEVYARQGMEEEAAEYLTRAAAFNPEYDMDAGEYPPVFIGAFGQSRDGLLKQEKGSIFVDKSAKGATVSIDGRELGTAPLRVKGLPPGKHLVRIYQENVGLFGAIIEVEEGDEATVRPGFIEGGGDGPLDVLAQNRFSPSGAKAVAKAAKNAGLTAAVVGVIDSSRARVTTALIVVDAASGNVRQLPVLEFDGDLLNLAIESLKGMSGIEKTIATKKFGEVGDEELIEGGEGGGEVKEAETTLRYDVKPILKRKRNKRRAISGRDTDDDDEDDNKPAKRKRRRRRLGEKKGEKKKSFASRSNRFDDESEDSFGDDDEGSLFTSPLFIGAAVGGVAIAGAAIGAGAGAAFYFLTPPAGRSVTVETP